jgi:hypothetical protein
VLRPVPVVDVPVEDRDALDSAASPQVRGRDGGVVEEAEAHRLGALGVVARRPRGDERALAGSLEHEVDRAHRAAGRRERGAEGVRRHARVALVEHARAARDRGLDGVDVRGVVDERDRLAVGRGRLLDPELAEQAARLEPPRDRAEPLAALGVAGTRVVPREERAREERGPRHPLSARFSARRPHSTRKIFPYFGCSASFWNTGSFASSASSGCPIGARFSSSNASLSFPCCM